PFSIIKHPAYSAGSFHNISGHCARMWLLHWLFCCWFFNYLDFIAIIVQSKGLLIFLDDVIIVILFDEWGRTVQPCSGAFRYLERVIGVCLSELIHAARE